MRYQNISRKLAIFIGTSNVLNSLVSNTEFRDFVEELNPKYDIPGRAAMSKALDLLLMEMKGKISAGLNDSGKIALTIDLWSKKGMSESFLGVTAHSFIRKSHKRLTATLAVRRFPPPHTADRVLEILRAVLDEWGLEESRISRVLTDNVSNMVAAFKIVRNSISLDKDDSEAKIDSGDCNVINLEQSPSDTEQLSSESEEDNPLKEMEKNAEEEIAEFEEEELQHDLLFSGHFSRASCFAHTLQLVARWFDASSSVKRVISKMHNLVAKFNRSTKCTERLIHLSGKKLVADCPTRWSSTFLVVSRLLELRVHVSAVCAELTWDCLQNSDWKMLENYKQLLEPFANYTNLESAEDMTTISTVIPVLLELSMHLEEMGQKPGLAKVSSCMLQNLKKCFRKLQDTECVDFDPLYVAGTFLDPHYRLVLSREQVQAAKRMIVNAARGPTVTSSNSEAEEMEEQIGEMQEPKQKRFKYLTTVIAKKKELLGTPKAGSDKIDEEISRYQAELHELDEADDPMDYWVSMECQFSSLSLLAYDILSIPASSAPVERIFSASGDSCLGKRNRLSGTNLEREVLIKMNKHIL